MTNLTPAEAKAILAKPKRAKFGNRKTVVNGVVFDSAAEARRWADLGLLERAGHITDLQRQVTFPLYHGDWLLAHIRPDFVYRRDGKRVVEDVKSRATKTPLWLLKSQIFEIQYGQEIEIVE
jgi:hypothetical protein